MPIRLLRALTLWLSCCAGAAAAQERGNVLLVILDDVGADRIAAYGESPDAGPTPVIDSLAAGGVLFRNAYANPVCSPTRMAILTGRHGFRTGIGIGPTWGGGLGHGEFAPGPREVTLPEVLGAAGLRTALVGKWHLVGPDWAPDPYMHPILVGGFDLHVGSIVNLPEAAGGFFQWSKNVATAAGSQQLEVDHYATSDNVDDALRLIDEWRGRRWFLQLAFNAPHAPWHVPPAGLTTLAVDGGSPDALLYRADLEALDTELGRLLDGMPATVRARTTVLVVGDNGTPEGVVPRAEGNHYKGTVYEGGIHVPLIVAGHRVARPGREVEALAHVVDLFATVRELAGAPDPGTAVDSVSLLPYLLDPAAPDQRRWTYSEKFQPNGFGEPTEFQRTVRGGQYKLVRRHFTVQGPGGPQSVEIDELYDLLADPLEEHDLLVAEPVAPEAAAAYAELSGNLSELLASAP